jgi:hypothetical protein
MGEGFRRHERAPHWPIGTAVHCRLCGASTSCRYEGRETRENEGQCEPPCGCTCATKRKVTSRENPFFRMIRAAMDLP